MHNSWLPLVGRILLALIFFLSGIHKIGGYEGTQAYMAQMGVPGMLLPAVILLEVGGGLALMLGWFARVVSLALALFTLAAAVLFHSNFADQIQFIMFMKNLSMAGGLLMVTAYGAGCWSLDARRQRQPL